MYMIERKWGKEMMIPSLYIVIPCYNEQEVLPVTAPEFAEQVKKMQEEGIDI